MHCVYIMCIYIQYVYIIYSVFTMDGSSIIENRGLDGLTMSPKWLYPWG